MSRSTGSRDPVCVTPTRASLGKLGAPGQHLAWVCAWRPAGPGLVPAGHSASRRPARVDGDSRGWLFPPNRLCWSRRCWFSCKSQEIKAPRLPCDWQAAGDIPAAVQSVQNTVPSLSSHDGLAPFPLWLKGSDVRTQPALQPCGSHSELFQSDNRELSFQLGLSLLPDGSALLTRKCSFTQAHQKAGSTSFSKVSLKISLMRGSWTEPRSLPAAFDAG